MHIFSKKLSRHSYNPYDSNVVWILVEAPEGIKPIGVSWSTRGIKE